MRRIESPHRCPAGKHPAFDPQALCLLCEDEQPKCLQCTAETEDGRRFCDPECAAEWAYTQTAGFWWCTCGAWLAADEFCTGCLKEKTT